MNINITTDDSDAAILDAFATVTGWTEASGIAQEDWLNQKVTDYVLDQARTGMALAAAQPQRDAYVQAFNAARAAAVDTIPTTAISVRPTAIAEPPISLPPTARVP